MIRFLKKNNIFWDIFNKEYLKNIDKKIEYIELIGLDEEKKYLIRDIVFPSTSNTESLFNGTYLIEEDNEVGLFMFIQDNIDVYFYKCIFTNEFNFGNNLFRNDIFFKKCEFLGELKFQNSYKYRVDISDCKKIKILDFSFAKFDNKIKMKNSTISYANFNNTKFNDLVDFYNTEFEEINFIKTDFKGISVFSECKFKKDADFKYTTFEKIAIFRDAKFYKEIDLRDSIFKDESNFLNIKVNEINRETARIIKNSFKQQNNIIEANKFYALEMKEREKELEADLKKGKNFFEWLVFKIHGISSNHSQDWLLALFWIINFTFALGTIKCSINLFGLNFISFIPFIFIIIISLRLSTLENIFKNGFLVFFSLISYGLYSLITSDFQLHKVVNHINPFSVMNSWDNLTFGEFIYKIIIAYLIYQLIISIRQNTRRK